MFNEGSIAVIAENEKKAIKLMKSEEAYPGQFYNPDEPVKEHEIKNGFVFKNYGDS